MATTRRGFLRGLSLGAAALSALPLLRGREPASIEPPPGPQPNDLWMQTTQAVNSGGTLMYYSQNSWQRLPPGQLHQVLSVDAGGRPVWKDIPG